MVCRTGSLTSEWQIIIAVCLGAILLFKFNCFAIQKPHKVYVDVRQSLFLALLNMLDAHLSWLFSTT